MTEPIRASKSASEEFGVLWGLSWPVVLGLLGHMGTAVVDIAMVGRLGKEALASCALAHMWCHSLVLLGRGVLQGIDPIVSQAHGAGDKKRVAYALQECLAVALLVTVPLVLWHFLAGPGLGVLQQPVSLIPDAHRFSVVLAVGVLPMLLFSAIRQVAQGLGIMRPAAYTYLAITGINVVLNAGLMYGKWGLPELGVVGCAWSTSICQFIQLAIMIFLVRGTLREYWVSPWKAWRISGIVRVLRIGLPVGFQIGFEVWAFIFSGVIVGWLGETAVAAHTVALNLASVSFMMALGVSQAATTRVGNLLGAGESWSRSAWCALVLSCGFMIVSAGAFFFFPEELARVYTQDKEVLAIATVLIPIAAAFQLFDGLQNVAFGVLQGVGDVRVPMGITAIGLWLCGLPFGAWLAFQKDWGAPGVWTGLALGLAIMSMLLIWRIQVVAKRGVLRIEPEISAT